MPAGDGGNSVISPGGEKLNGSGESAGSARAPSAREGSRESGAFAAEIFDHFPYGILVTAADGTIVAANRSVQEMLSIGEEAPRCCDVLGCGRAGSPLEGNCITRLALEAGAPLPEIRTDLPEGHGIPAAWVTAAPTGERVVFNVRPGSHRDRRRRTEPHWIAGPVLSIRTLGRTHLETREGPIGGMWLKQRPGELLKYLITERHRVVHAEEIAHALWPHAGAAALGSVRHYIHAARDKLEPQRQKGTPSSFIVARGGGYALNVANVSIDADEFEAQVNSATTAVAQSEREAAAAHAANALELYQGDFLADEPYAEWAFMERERLRHLAAQAMRLVADIRVAEDDLEGAMTALRRLSEIEPFDLVVQRELIGLCLRMGHRSEAMRRYSTLRQRMLREFGEVPDFELADLTPDRTVPPAAPAPARERA